MQYSHLSMHAQPQLWLNLIPKCTKCLYFSKQIYGLKLKSAIWYRRTGLQFQGHLELDYKIQLMVNDTERGPLVALNRDDSIIEQTGTAKQVSVKTLLLNFKELCPLTQVSVQGHACTHTHTFLFCLQRTPKRNPWQVAWFGICNDYVWHIPLFK
jgi:hypothetical protein